MNYTQSKTAKETQACPLLKKPSHCPKWAKRNLFWCANPSKLGCFRTNLSRQPVRTSRVTSKRESKNQSQKNKKDCFVFVEAGDFIYEYFS